MWSDSRGRQPEGLMQARAAARALANVPVAPVAVQPDVREERVGTRPGPVHPDVLQHRIHGDSVEALGARPDTLGDRVAGDPFAR
jgi:hypothetical protein